MTTTKNLNIIAVNTIFAQALHTDPCTGISRSARENVIQKGLQYAFQKGNRHNVQVIQINGGTVCAESCWP